MTIHNVVKEIKINVEKIHMGYKNRKKIQIAEMEYTRGMKRSIRNRERNEVRPQKN